jgi:HlyD family secretion protein
MSNFPIRTTRGDLEIVGAEDDGQLTEALSVFESETAGVLAKTAPKDERIIIHIIMGMLLLTIVLSCVVKLDRVVSGTGTILSVGGPLFISPLNPGVVVDVRVKPGEIVKKGQILATMDATAANADLESNQQKVLSDSATIARLTAEAKDQPFDPPNDGNPYNQVQYAIWVQRQAQYKATMSSDNAQASAAQGLLEQYQLDVKQYQKRYQLATRRQQMVAPLVAKGYVSEVQLNTAQDTSVELERQLADSRKQIQQQIQTVSSLHQQASAFEHQWHSDINNLLVATRNDLDAAQGLLDKAKLNVQLSTLVSPAPAVVLKIARVSTGSIAGVGTAPQTDATNPQLITLAPLDAPLEAEINVASMDVGFIRKDDPVTIKLDAYDYLRHGLVKGKIKSISEGSFTRDDNDTVVPPYFKVRVAISEVNLHNVPSDFRLIPGMTLTGDAHIGKRTIISYLIEGAMHTGSEAMREAQ